MIPDKAIESDNITSAVVHSVFLKREVIISLYNHQIDTNTPPCLCIVNDGQDLISMDFKTILSASSLNRPMIFAGVHCGKERVEEYGMSAGPDYLNRGKKGQAYENFIIKELIPWLKKKYPKADFSQNIIAGFSMGGLKALDIAWNHPQLFSWAAVFSGALWWRSVSADDAGYDENLHRMMHHQILNSEVPENLKLFFQCGLQDEAADRNKNGVIDSIDDTIDLMRILLKKGKLEGKDFFYLQMPHGKHDISTWGKAWPVFLKLLQL